MNKLTKDEIDSLTALFPKHDIVRPRHFIPKFIQIKAKKKKPTQRAAKLRVTSLLITNPSVLEPFFSQLSVLLHSYPKIMIISLTFPTACHTCQVKTDPKCACTYMQVCAHTDAYREISKDLTKGKIFPLRKVKPKIFGWNCNSYTCNQLKVSSCCR